MKKLLFLLLVLVSCADSTKRIEHLRTVYPNCKVEPATGVIQQNGFEFIVIDTNIQIIAVDFYPFSETKIWTLRNIR